MEHCEGKMEQRGSTMEHCEGKMEQCDGRMEQPDGTIEELRAQGISVMKK